MGRDFPRKRDGDGVEPRDLNEVYAELRRWRSLRGAGGVDVSGAAGGVPSAALARTGRMLARLTGAYASGYPWEEVLIGPSRSVVTTGRTGDPASGDPAFERRTGDTGLTAGGAVYEFVRSPASGEWVFPHRGVACRLCVTVRGCQVGATALPLAGALVSVSRAGSPVGSATTDAAGLACVDVPAAGSYSFTVSKARFSPKTQLVFVDCPRTNVTVDMHGNADTTNYKCTLLCADPLPNTLHLTSGTHGAFTLTWSGSAWQVIANVNYPGCPAQSCGAVNPCQVRWTFDTFGNVSLEYGLVIASTVCPQHSLVGGSTREFTYARSAGGTCPPAFSQTYTSSDPYFFCGATDTVTVTE
jgi:Carboxypeptidase regulatory-like domain